MILQARIAGKSHGGTPVLGRCDIDIAGGETVALVGPSGIGKTTLLRIVAGIDRRFEGTVSRPARLAMVFQEPTLLRWRTARQNLTLVHPGLAPQGARDMLARVGLAGLEHRFPGQLSLGQQRRLSLARAFAARPELLIMDEPLVSLDAEAAEEMIRLIEELIAETRPAVLFVTHTPSDADRLATRILELRGDPASPVLIKGVST